MSQIRSLKKRLYFFVAYYFKFFAQIQLGIWKPKIIVVTGSTGKTTLLHILESQIQEQAMYSHRANSSFGIPFNILGLERKSLTLGEWPALFFLAPLKAFQNLHKQRIYIVEADCDRPYEGKFLAQLLKPSITIWLSSSKTHTLNFTVPVEENIAKEFGYFLENTSGYSIVNGDSKLILDQLVRTHSEVKKINKKSLESYQIFKKGTSFKIAGKVFTINYLLPEDTSYLILATFELLKKLNIPFDSKFAKLILPPGRSSLLKGIKKTTIVDSSYNATPASVTAILKMFKVYPASKKWVVLGDMIELGTEEQIEHQKLAPFIAAVKPEKIILIGPRVSRYTYPKLYIDNAYKFDDPKEALIYIKHNLSGGEVILFKGARFLEGIIEHLLENKEDVSKLCRREAAWQERRKKWGL